MHQLLQLYIGLKLLRFLIELGLSKLNRNYYLSGDHQKLAREALNISQENMTKTLEYTEDRYKFGVVSGWMHLFAEIAFIALGGLGWTEGLAAQISNTFFGGGTVITGLIFFAVFAALSFLFNLPFSIYSTFIIEQKHGFNRQNAKGFISDSIKGVLLGAILGGILLSLLLFIMETIGEWWWLAGWAVVSIFSLFAAWIYPSLLAPLFNKFSPLEKGELKSGIEEFAQKIGFRTNGIFIMDASKRSSHGNAYFTGLFGEKRIVLFDTLLDSMSNKQIIAVLAHELGHFKLNHVRWGMIRGILSTGVMFYLMSLILPIDEFYSAFHFSGMSYFAALVVFSLWIGTIDFYLSPLSTWISRKNEFEADAFARTHLGSHKDLSTALVQLREANHSMPLTHPLYSTIYHSHPPMLERLKALENGN